MIDNDDDRDADDDGWVIKRAGLEWLFILVTYCNNPCSLRVVVFAYRYTAEAPAEAGSAQWWRRACCSRWPQTGDLYTPVVSL